MNKKGIVDFPLVSFIIVGVMLLLMAPIVLKVVTSTTEPFANALGNTTGAGGEVAKANVSYVKNTFVSFWDGVILFCFLIIIIMLFMSAFLIDASPFFAVMYIIMFFVTILFAPSVLEVVDGIYDNASYVNEVAHLGVLDFIRLNFGLILTFIGILTMIIIYAKLRFNQ
jgi:hypothetical protein